MCLIYAIMVLAWYHLSVVVVRLFSILYVFVLLFSLHACAFTVYRTVVVQKRGEKNYPALCTRHISVEVKLWICAHGLMTKKCVLPKYNSRLGRRHLSPKPAQQKSDTLVARIRKFSFLIPTIKQVWKREGTEKKLSVCVRNQVWSITQFYSVGFLQSRITEKVFFSKRTI